MSERPAVPIAVCVSGRGSSLRAISRAQGEGWLGGRVVLVLADRPCPALDWARDQSIPTAVVRPGDHPDEDAWDRAVAVALTEANARVVALAGFLRSVGPATVAAFRGRMLKVHPSLLPAFPGTQAVRDALRAGVRVTGVTVRLIDEVPDGGPILLQETLAVLPGDDEASLFGRLQALEHRLLPRAVALLAAGAVTVTADGRAALDLGRASPPGRPRQALLSVSDRTGLEAFAQGLAELGFALVATEGTARILRAAGLEVTDVAAVTGVPEMLDGRVKTLHPRIMAGVLADLRRPDHIEQLAAEGIDPFELVVVNLYPFAAAAARPGTGLEQLVEQIDIGGPTLIRAAAKNHACVGVVTDPSDYPAVLAELRAEGRLGAPTRQQLAAAAFRYTAEYEARIAAELAARLASSPTAVLPGGAHPEATPASPEVAPRVRREAFPTRLSLELERVQVLRYGENPHQRAAVYRLPGTPEAAGPFAQGIVLLQGKALSYNNLLDAAAAAALVRDLRGPACVIVKHANPCGAAEAGDSVGAWQRALAGDPVSAYGGVVAVTDPLDAPLARALTASFLELLIVPGLDPVARAVLARRPNLRVVLAPGSGDAAGERVVEYRSAGGAILASEADQGRDDPATWRQVATRAPGARERQDLDLAWRLVRHVKSNAIVLVRDGVLVGIGAGQMSRLDSARLAIQKAGPERARGAVCASDGFYPFPDAMLVCAEAGVTAFVQPGGSMRDDQVIRAAETAGVSMMLTGIRHFRH
ncbi:MAG: bifunctional phosphoribosylaminoimidazolecarboxamide formyltransferase/IMP cyclohydrolase [Candidatus Limnocylindrales bacterium]